MEAKKRILIAAPLHQKPEYFVEYQESLDNLIIPDGYEVGRLFIVNNNDEIIPYLKNCQYAVINFDKAQEIAHDWRTDDLFRMAYMRNQIVKYTLDNGYDYLFSVDTDLVLRPETLQTLLETDKDIISEAFWTDFIDRPGFWYNASFYIFWEANESSTKVTVDAIKGHMQPGVYEVGMTGACTLIKREVFEKGVNYEPVYHLADIWSEDRFFCVRALCAGFQPYIDTHCPPYHLYTDKEYQKYLRFKKDKPQEDNSWESL